MADWPVATDNVSPEIENLIILSTSLHSTLAGALIRFIINKIPSVPPQAALTSDKAAGRLLWLGIVKLELSWQESYEFPSEICESIDKNFNTRKSRNMVLPLQLQRQVSTPPLPLPPRHRNRNNLKLPCSVFESENKI